MKEEGLAKALMMLFALAFSWPFLAAVDRSAWDILGIPPIMVYVFGGWALLVVALAAVSRKLKD